MRGNYNNLLEILIWKQTSSKYITTTVYVETVFLIQKLSSPWEQLQIITIESTTNHFLECSILFLTLLW